MAGEAIPMEITVRIVNIYGCKKHVHDTILDVPAPTLDDFRDNLEGWSTEHLFPHTGDGRATDTEAAYFVNIVTCASFPGLKGREFAWGI